MEELINITYLNDFIFCPISIYFHNLDYETETKTYQDKYQINGKAAHYSYDTATYSSRKDILQGISVFNDEFGLIGKIDTFNVITGTLVERKNKIVRIYDGYIYQLYAQYYSLKEMGFKVNELKLYSISDNKSYIVEKPEENKEQDFKFRRIINDIKNFQIENFEQLDKNKCNNCIYFPLCSYSK